MALSRARRRGTGGVGTFGQSAAGAGNAKPDAQAARALAKELQAVERRMQRVSASIAALHERMAAHDQSDYAGIGKLSEDLRALESEHTELEDRWLELSEELG